MLRARFILLAGSAFAAAAMTAACGPGETTGTGGGGGDGGGAPVKLHVPPEAPDKTPGDGPGVVLAINKLYIGDTDRDDKPSTDAWEEFGYDLDGKVSTKSSTDLCKPAQGAKADTVYPDGVDGTDNSFGKNILPIILPLAMDASTQINESINSGSFTIMLKIEGIGTGDAYNPLLTKLYAGSKLVDENGMEIEPKWDGSDKWPVVPELLNNGNIDNPVVQFPDSYVVKSDSGARTWVSGGAGDLKLNLAIAGFTLGLTIGKAIISTELASDNKSGKNGIIAGILSTEQLIAELAKVAGSFDDSLCPPSATFESIAQQIRQASDIMADGSQNPNKTCDGISIGLGFEMAEVQLGEVAKAAEPQPDPCSK